METADEGVIFRDLHENENGSFAKIPDSKLNPADSIVISISQGPRNTIVSTGTDLDVHNRGLLITDENGRISRPGILVSDDVVCRNRWRSGRLQ